MKERIVNFFIDGKKVESCKCNHVLDVVKAIDNIALNEGLFNDDSFRIIAKFTNGKNAI